MCLLKALTLSALLCAPAFAQRVTGIIRDTALSVPLAGAVVSTLDSLRRPLGRAITDAAGRFSLGLPAGATQLRVVRIGFQPRTHALGPGREGTVVADIWMTKVATLLSTVLVNDDRICSPRDGRVEALSLWEQARAGLLASVVAREALPAIAMLLRYDRRVNVGTPVVLLQTAVILTGRTSRPFAADAPSVLAERGYLHEDASGLRFDAPDADVLLDDSFAATHCFSVQQADAEHPGAIGLAFEPARGRDALIDVRGTLWLNAAVPALRSLEFRYTGGDRSWEAGGAAGFIHFHAMANGVVFIDEWKLRLPVMQRSERRESAGYAGDVAFTRTTRVTQMSETGGFVLSGTWPDQLHFQSELKPYSGIVREEGTGRPLGGALVVIEATRDTVVADSVGRFELFPLLPGRYVVRTADTTFARFVAPRYTTGEVVIEPGQAIVSEFTLPGRADAVQSLCGRGERSSTSSVLLGRIADMIDSVRLPRDLRVEAIWLKEGSVTLRETQTVSLDESGRFSICGVPRERAILLATHRAGAVFADTTVRIYRDSAVMAMAWALDVRRIAGMLLPKLASLRGRVTREGVGNGVVGADVWLPLVDRHATTDSTGVFRVDSLPPRHTVLQVRRVGFGVRRDTLTLVSGTETTREYALSSSATMLDTVRTVATGTNHLSPALRGFEERRVKQTTGYFISDSAMRSQGDKALSSIISSRVNGLTLVPGPSGALFMVSSRIQCAGSVMTICNAPNCVVTTYLDGILIYSGATGTPPVDATRVRARDLAGVEFYPSGAPGPPEYNATGSGCGTLLLWTRER